MQLPPVSEKNSKATPLPDSVQNPVTSVFKKAFELTNGDLFLSSSDKIRQLRKDIYNVIELKRREMIEIERQILVCDKLVHKFDRSGGLDSSLLISFLSEIDTTDILFLIIRSRDPEISLEFPPPEEDLREILRLSPNAKSLRFERVVMDKDLDLLKGMEKVYFDFFVNASDIAMLRFRENNPALKSISFEDIFSNMHLLLPSSLREITVRHNSYITRDFWMRTLELPELESITTDCPTPNSIKLTVTEATVHNLEMILTQKLAFNIEFEAKRTPYHETIFRELNEKFPNKFKVTFLD